MSCDCGSSQIINFLLCFFLPCKYDLECDFGYFLLDINIKIFRLQSAVQNTCPIVLALPSTFIDISRSKYGTQESSKIIQKKIQYMYILFKTSLSKTKNDHIKKADTFEEHLLRIFIRITSLM